MIQIEQLIEEVKKRPGLWNSEHSIDRLEKLTLWKEIGSEIFKDWDTINKATAYDRVLQLQKKWRSLRDAYNRELRARKRGIRRSRRVYVYFKRLCFLGGYEGLPEPADPFDFEQQSDDNVVDHDDGHDIEETPEVDVSIDDPLINNIVKKKRRKTKRLPPEYEEPDADLEMPIFPIEVDQRSDNDEAEKLFLLSFVPEMKKLPPNIKMWARAQIANVMQEAVTCHFNNTQPSGADSHSRMDIKRQRHSSTE